MSLFRIAIRRAIAQSIRDSATKAQERVHEERIDLPDRADEIPAVCVLTAGETAETHVLSPRSYKLKATFALELFVRRVETVEIAQELADELAAEVRAAADRAVACLTEIDVPIEGLLLLVDETGYVETQFELDNRGQTIIGGARVLYEVTWVEPATFPLDAVELSNWLRTHVTFKSLIDPAAPFVLSGFEHPQG